MNVELRVEGDDLIVTLPCEAKALSTTVHGGGLKNNLRHIVFHHVPHDFNSDPVCECRNVLEDLGLRIDESSVFLTAVPVSRNYVVVEDSFDDVSCLTTVTVGLSNPVSIMHNGSSKGFSTINILVVVDRDVQDNGLVELVKTVAEAKVSAVHDLDLRHGSTYAIGTSTDAIVTASLRKPPTRIYTGQLTPIGSLVSRLVYKAIIKGAENWGFRQDRSMIKRLEERGIRLDDIINTALTLFIPWSGLEMGEAYELIKSELLRCLEDVNVVSIVDAALRLDEDARIGLIPGLKPQQYISDPVNLVSDEVLALSLALYLNGWNAVFELYRYDTKKPGILSKLPPFIDDVVASLIAGVTSRIYSRGGL
jgi:alpha-ribazole phosphatase CobZ